MAFTKSKMTKLKASSLQLDAIIQDKDAEIKEFEDALVESDVKHTFNFIIGKGEPEEETGLTPYAELSWSFFHGPLPKPYEAGWHFTIRRFKVEEANYGNERKYQEFNAAKVYCSTLQDKEVAVQYLDEFMDAFEGAISTKVNK